MSKSSFLVLVNKVVSIFPLVKPFSKRNPLNLSYHALGACFKPYKALVNLEIHDFQNRVVIQHKLLHK